MGGGSAQNIKRKHMRTLTLDEMAKYLDHATIERTIDVGHAFIHIGMTVAGFGFVMVNNFFGETVVSESL
jgi:hypothetical protein